MRKTRIVRSSSKFGSYPPRVPVTKAELERVLCLLGNKTKAELNRKAHEELVTLVRNSPSQKEASAKKQYLKAVLKQKLCVEG